MKIPAGVDEGTRIRVAGEGEAGVRGAASGDLYLFVHMKRHPIYAREGTTLIADCPVSFTTAALGGAISLPGLDGKPVEIKIPAGIQSGEQLRHRGAGMSVLNGRGRGDLVARILVETPTQHVSQEQKKLLEEFRETETGDECPAAKSFFGRVRDYLRRLISRLQPVDLEPHREQLREQFGGGVKLEARLRAECGSRSGTRRRSPSTSNGTRSIARTPALASCVAAHSRRASAAAPHAPTRLVSVAREDRERLRRRCRQSIAGRSASIGRRRRRRRGCFRRACRRRLSVTRS